VTTSRLQTAKPTAVDLVINGETANALGFGAVVGLLSLEFCTKNP
jgi:hypothetical protein